MPGSNYSSRHFNPLILDNDTHTRLHNHRLELLSPARGAGIARETILHGTDTVYIGGPDFGARHNVSNSLSDIVGLVPFAHRYGTKIFITLSTILHDDELGPAQRLITDLYGAGVDALIMQDMGTMELDLPPIELRASTQCDIRSVKKAKFLSDAGFSRIVLTRELGLSQIKAVCERTDTTVEFFIHDALYVAYSGQCNISHAQTGRSANRGDCSQACRLPHTLKDDQGRVVAYGKHPLSMRGNDQAADLVALIGAGIRSFKIEGRYKGMSYAKNITAHYRQVLDAIIGDRGGLARTSAGRAERFSIPSTDEAFHRSNTDYFVNAHKGDIGVFDSPEFTRLPVGEVLKVGENHLDVGVSKPLASGDGLNVMIKREVVGFRAGTVEETDENRYRVWPNEVPADLRRACPHQALNRNLDHNWQQALLETSSECHITVGVMLSGWQEQLVPIMACEDGVNVTHTLDGAFAETNQTEEVLANLRDGVTKLGQTIYYPRDAQVNLPPLSVPDSLLNQLRRETAKMLDEARLNAWQHGTCKPVSVSPPVYPKAHPSFLTNVYNHKVQAFYQHYGVQLIDAAYEAHEEKSDVPVMITKHYLRFAFNLCPKQAEGSIRSWRATPMQLVHDDEVLTLKFDCRPCEMHVVRKIKNHILKMPLPGSIVTSVNLDGLMKTLPERKGA